MAASLDGDRHRSAVGVRGLPPVQAMALSAASVGLDFLVGSIEELLATTDSEPHRHDFDEVIYITEGSGVYYVDELEVQIRPPHLFVATHGQVHHWVGSEPLKGTLVQFRSEFLTGLGGPVIELEPVPSVELTDYPRMKARIDRIVVDLELEQHRSDMLRELAIRTLLATLFINLHRLGPDRDALTTSLGVATRFLAHVRRNVSAQLTVADCARTLGVSVGHLSDLVAERTGRSAGQVIRGEVVVEAKRLLARTELTCAQIAHQLGFADPAYFSRFFRREGGCSPTEYRGALTPQK